jgi:hypothetical protein
MAKVSELFKKYDPRSEAVWKTWNGAEFLIAPQGNKMQQKEMLNEFTLQEASDFESKGPMAFGDMKANESLKKVYSLYAKTIIFDWKLEDDSDKPIKFTSAKCLEFMLDDLSFSNWILMASQEVSREKEAKEKEIEKK